MAKYELSEALKVIRENYINMPRPKVIELSRIILKNSLTGIREINKSQLQSFEDGRSKNPSWTTITALLEVYGITPLELLTFMNTGEFPDRNSARTELTHMTSFIAKIPLYNTEKEAVFGQSQTTMTNAIDSDYDFAFIVTDEAGQITVPGVIPGSIAHCKKRKPNSGDYVCVHRTSDNRLLMYRYADDGMEITLRPIYDFFSIIIPNDSFRIVGVVHHIGNTFD